MVFFKRFSLLMFGMLLTVFIAACGTNPTNSGTMTGSNTTTTGTNGNAMGMATPTTASNMGGNMNDNNNMGTPTGNMNNNNNMGTPTGNMNDNNNMGTPTNNMGNNNNNMGTPTNNMGNNNNNMGGNMDNAALIHTTQVTLNGAKVTVLTNTKGMVLYYKRDDPKNGTTCTGACAQDWPPYLANDMNMMTVTSTMQLPHKLTVVKTANGNQIAYDGHVLYTYVGDMTPGQFTGRAMDNVWYLVAPGL